MLRQGLVIAPNQIDKYPVLRPLPERGGMSKVYLAMHPTLGRAVVIKVLADELLDDDGRNRFQDEAKRVAALRHANIVTVHDMGEFGSHPYIVMEYVDGKSFGKIISEDAHLTRHQQRLLLQQKVRYLIQLASGLLYAHRADIVHRDIKPANLMVDRDGQVRILDFGIALQVGGERRTPLDVVVGTPNYMSPEQLQGQLPDHRSDIFSVGAVAYELLSGKKAFPGTMNQDLAHRLMVADPAPLRQQAAGLDLSREIEDVVMRMLAKSRDDRYQSLDEVLRDLNATPEALTDPTVVEARDRERCREFVAASQRALRRGQLDEALDAANNALSLFPDDREAAVARDAAEAARYSRERIAQAEALLVGGNATEALHVARDVLARVPDDPKAIALADRAARVLIVDEAVKDSVAGRPQEALARLRTAVPFWRVHSFYADLLVQTATAANQRIQAAVNDVTASLRAGNIEGAYAALEAAAVLGASVDTVKDLLSSLTSQHMKSLIREFLTRYEARWSEKDVAGIRALWPNVPDAELDRLQRPHHRIRFRLDAIRMNGDNAGIIIAMETSETHSRKVSIAFSAVGDSWIIREIKR